ncbi:hypothetical protein GDO86_015158 [Hymenochirus boettgeri]|uniref:Uncharacterized protein n=1 Tax=Hymenochirus boettgeri TaxID=247094 RepID=A0A8T2JXK4_9PIPI|nr:hypothetical protein GDO86_015158 [Hymenochirus boettgeri]
MLHIKDKMPSNIILNISAEMTVELEGGGKSVPAFATRCRQKQICLVAMQLVLPGMEYHYTRVFMYLCVYIYYIYIYIYIIFTNIHTHLYGDACTPSFFFVDNLGASKNTDAPIC